MKKLIVWIGIVGLSLSYIFTSTQANQHAQLYDGSKPYYTIPSAVYKYSLSTSKSDSILLYSEEDKLTQLKLYIAALCEELDIPVEVAYQIITVESAGNPYAVSYAGAIGLMQVKPIAAKEVLGWRPTRSQLMNPFFNVMVGLRYYKWLQQEMKGRHQASFHALVAYNMGIYRYRSHYHASYNPQQYIYVQKIMRAKHTDITIKV